MVEGTWHEVGRGGSCQNLAVVSSNCPFLAIQVAPVFRHVLVVMVVVYEEMLLCSIVVQTLLLLVQYKTEGVKSIPHSNNMAKK